jgi:hypothetical protein
MAQSSIRLMRGVRLVNERLDGDGFLVYDLEIAWWRRMLLVAQAMWRARPSVSFWR